MSTVWIRVAYGVAIALLTTFTVVFGIAMVAPGPKAPADPGITFRQLSGDDSSGGSRGQNQLQAQIEKFYGEASSFRSEYPTYQRNVFLAATGLGVLVVLIGLALPAAVNYLRWGFVLGGVLLFVYAFGMATRDIPRVTPSGNGALDLLGAGSPAQLSFASRFIQFAVAFIGLILALFLGLWRLTEWSAPQRRRTAASAAATAPAAAVGPPPAASQWAPPPSAPPLSVPVASTAPVAGAVPPAPAPGSAEAGDKETVEVHAPEWRRPD